MTVFMFFVLKVIIFILIISESSLDDSILRSTKSLANFRKSVEETSIDNHPEKSNHDSDIKFVAFLLENAKKIFSNTDEPNKTVESFSIDGIKLDSLNMHTVNGTTEQNAAYNESHNENNILNLGYLDTNLSKSPSTENVMEIKKSEKLSVFTDYNISLTEIGQLFTEKPTDRNPENFLLLEKKDVAKIDKNARKPQQLPSLEATIFSQKNTRRSCIACNNIGSMDCMDPQNKLISSKLCDSEEDLCYSMHTPFGIVDRGCFDVNHNLSTYVCSCNLCNYISISEMPYMFSGKQDWLENVKELYRTKRLRNSIHKDMSCLRCEVNASLKTTDMIDNENCLAGNIIALPIQDCASNEICGVKAIKSEGYIWRGCLSTPLYNYWWTLCGTDFCNYDHLATIYDEF